MQLLEGIELAKTKTQELKNRVQNLKKPPHLLIIQVGSDPSSTKYVRAKETKAQEIGIGIEIVKIPISEATTESLVKLVKDTSEKVYNGVIVQLPLPTTIDQSQVLNAINPELDVDGLIIDNPNPKFLPATVKGVLSLMNYHQVRLENKDIAVVGQSNLVGKPLAMTLEKLGPLSLKRYDKTTGIDELSKADIVFVAIGEAKYIKGKDIKNEAVIFDIGTNWIINKVQERELVGDVDFNSIKSKASAYTPVPGGVGPLTVVSLMENVVLQAERKQTKIL